MTQPVPGAVEQVFSLTFNGPSDTFTFEICQGLEAGDLGHDHGLLHPWRLLACPI